MQEKIYKLSWSKGTIITTILSLGIVVSALLPITFFTIRDESQDLLLLVYLFFISFIVMTYGYSPKKIVISEKYIKIIKGIGEIEIDKKTIVSFRKLEKKDMVGTVRKAASGGIFGYFGRFSNPQIGEFKMYTTKKNDLLLIKTSYEEQFVVAPDNLEEFIKDLG